MIRAVVIPERYQHLVPSDFAYDATHTLDLIESEWDKIVCKPYIIEYPNEHGRIVPVYDGPMWQVYINATKHSDEWTMSFQMPFDLIRETIKHDPKLTSIIFFQSFGQNVRPYDNVAVKQWLNRLDKESSLFAG